MKETFPYTVTRKRAHQNIFNADRHNVLQNVAVAATVSMMKQLQDLVGVAQNIFSDLKSELDNTCQRVGSVTRRVKKIEVTAPRAEKVLQTRNLRKRAHQNALAGPHKPGPVMSAAKRRKLEARNSNRQLPFSRPLPPIPTQQEQRPSTEETRPSTKVTRRRIPPPPRRLSPNPDMDEKTNIPERRARKEQAPPPPPKRRDKEQQTTDQEARQEEGARKAAEAANQEARHKEEARKAAEVEAARQKEKARKAAEAERLAARVLAWSGRRRQVARKEEERQAAAAKTATEEAARKEEQLKPKPKRRPPRRLDGVFSSIIGFKIGALKPVVRPPSPPAAPSPQPHPSSDTEDDVHSDSDWSDSEDEVEEESPMKRALRLRRENMYGKTT